MKSLIKKIATLVLMASIIASLAGCGGGKDSGSGQADKGGNTKAPEYLNMDSALPVVKDGNDITLKVLVMEGAYYEDMDSIKDVYFVNAYEKKTNVKIEWIEVSKDAFADKLALMISTDDLPDVIIKGGVSNSTQLKYGDQGYFLDLMKNDMLKKYAPNYWALTQKYPEILSAS
jgi:putative aldouronate transport system substrate-binding protein